MRQVRLIAVKSVVASDLILRRPGDVFDCGADDAETLIANGAATDATGDLEPPTELTAVSGIGPSTAARLVEAGIADLASLAALPDDQIAGLTLPTWIQDDLRDNWRTQARALLEPAR